MSFLDLKMAWNMNGKLQFQAYRKPNQIIKYISIELHHAPAQLFNVARSELECLTSLITINNITRKMKPEEIYPEHVKKLKEARLWRQNMDSWKFDYIEKNMKSVERKEKKEERDEYWRSQRNTYFVSAWTNRWNI